MPKLLKNLVVLKTNFILFQSPYPPPWNIVVAHFPRVHTGGGADRNEAKRGRGREPVCEGLGATDAKHWQRSAAISPRLCQGPLGPQNPGVPPHRLNYGVLFITRNSKKVNIYANFSLHLSQWLSRYCLLFDFTLHHDVYYRPKSRVHIRTQNPGVPLDLYNLNYSV